jgi:hypothetical protein
VLRAALKVDTIDSYQGKQNPIVIVSLVRNNWDGDPEHGDKTIAPGFLATAPSCSVPQQEKRMSGQIDVIVTVDAPLSAEEKVRGAFAPARGASRIAHVSLEAAIVEAGLRDMIDKLGDVFLAPTAATRNFEVDEIELSLAIDAKGSVSLIGSIEVGGHAGIKVKLKRKRAEK